MNWVKLILVVLVLTLSCKNSSAQSEEDSLRLAWAVRRLVRPTDCNSSSTDLGPPRNYYPARPGKIGPVGPPGCPGEAGPKGEAGSCVCNRTETNDLKQMIQNLEDKISTMESQMPEAFCLLGMKSGMIPDSAITASSVHSASYCKLANARLDHHGAWCAVANTIGSQWVEVDLGKIQKVTGVVTQGQGNYPNTNEWITSFKIEYATREGSRTALTENNNYKVFSPVNFNKNTIVVTRFPEPIQARYIRIIPASYHSHMSMRFDVINC
ncbi:lactadherin-like [Styela clava]